MGKFDSLGFTLIAVLELPAQFSLFFTVFTNFEKNFRGSVSLVFSLISFVVHLYLLYPFSSEISAKWYYSQNWNAGPVSRCISKG